MANDFDEVPGGNDPRRQSDYFTYDMAAIIQRTEELIASGDAFLFVPVLRGGFHGVSSCSKLSSCIDERCKELS